MQSVDLLVKITFSINYRMDGSVHENDHVTKYIRNGELKKKLASHDRLRKYLEKTAQGSRRTLRDGCLLVRGMPP